VGNSQDIAPSSSVDIRSHPSRPLAASSPRVGRLTEREHQVARLIAQGLKDIVIARRLGISTSTVAVYVGHIKQRLRLATRAEIAAWVTARLDPDHPAGRQRRADQARTADPHCDSRAS
jgi:DNA-binding NarL/FixJ family response regulator